MSRFVLPFCLLLLWSCCERPFPYAVHQELDDAQWDVTDTLRFGFPKASRDCDATLEVSVQTLPDYEYRNLVVRVQQVSRGYVVASDTLSFCLMGADGKTLSQGFMHANTRSRRMTLHRWKGKSDTLLISHNMRLTSLQGVTGVTASLSE